MKTFNRGDVVTIIITGEKVMILAVTENSYKVRMSDYNIREFYYYELSQ